MAANPKTSSGGADGSSLSLQSKEAFFDTSKSVPFQHVFRSKLISSLIVLFFSTREPCMTVVKKLLQVIKSLVLTASEAAQN